jgi:hypothetical protein
MKKRKEPDHDDDGQPPLKRTKHNEPRYGSDDIDDNINEEAQPPSLPSKKTLKENTTTTKTKKQKAPNSANVDNNNNAPKQNKITTKSKHTEPNYGYDDIDDNIDKEAQMTLAPQDQQPPLSPPRKTLKVNINTNTTKTTKKHEESDSATIDNNIDEDQQPPPPKHTSKRNTTKKHKEPINIDNDEDQDQLPKKKTKGNTTKNTNRFPLIKFRGEETIETEVATWPSWWNYLKQNHLEEFENQTDPQEDDLTERSKITFEPCRACTGVCRRQNGQWFCQSTKDCLIAKYKDNAPRMIFDKRTWIDLQDQKRYDFSLQCGFSLQGKSCGARYRLNMEKVKDNESSLVIVKPILSCQVISNHKSELHVVLKAETESLSKRRGVNLVEEKEEEEEEVPKSRRIWLLNDDVPAESWTDEEDREFLQTCNATEFQDNKQNATEDLVIFNQRLEILKHKIAYIQNFLKIISEIELEKQESNNTNNNTSNTTNNNIDNNTINTSNNN